MKTANGDNQQLKKRTQAAPVAGMKRHGRVEPRAAGNGMKRRKTQMPKAQPAWTWERRTWRIGVAVDDVGGGINCCCWL